VQLVRNLILGEPIFLVMIKTKTIKKLGGQLLFKAGFKKLLNNKYVISRILYDPLIILKIEISLKDNEIQWDVIDKNTQTTYYPFWNNVNGERNRVVIKVKEKFTEYIKELQNMKILRRNKKYERANKRYQN